MRTIKSFFDSFEGQTQNQKALTTILVSMFEIYAERVIDLLNVPEQGAPQTSRYYNIKAEDLYLYEVRTAEDVEQLYDKGTENKSRVDSQQRQESGQSHIVISIQLERNSSLGDSVENVSRLIFVELASIDRLPPDPHDWDRNRQMIEIEKSMETLKSVFASLYGKEESHDNIPFKDSKLTAVLESSLRSKFFCLLIACINPLDECYRETLATLQFVTDILGAKPADEQEQLSSQKSSNSKVRDLQFRDKAIEEHFLKMKRNTNDQKQIDNQLFAELDQLQAALPRLDVPLGNAASKENDKDDQASQAKENPYQMFPGEGHIDYAMRYHQVADYSYPTRQNDWLYDNQERISSIRDRFQKLQDRLAPYK